MKNLITIFSSIILISIIPHTLTAQLPFWDEIRSETKFEDEKSIGLENSNTWIDSEGNLWVYGGQIIKSDETKTLSNQLWKYESLNNQWKQIISNDAENELKAPKSRIGATTWYDPKGILWLFGGLSYENKYQNELWQYQIDSNTWIQVPNNLEDKENPFPGGRRDAASWIDENRNLWLFGGKAESNEKNYEGLNNDLWFFQIEKMIWKRIDVKANETKDDFLPDPRILAATWFSNNNELVLYGGLGQSKSNYFGGYSDCWIYNIKDNIWRKIEFEKFDEKIDFYEKQYGVSQFESKESHPGFRIKSSFWRDKDGYFWLYGGQTIITSEKTMSEPYLWRLNLKTNLWTYFPIENDIKYIWPQGIFENLEGKLLLFAPQVINERGEKSHSLNMFHLNNKAK